MDRDIRVVRCGKERAGIHANAILMYKILFQKLF